MAGRAAAGAENRKEAWPSFVSGGWMGSLEGGGEADDGPARRVLVENNRLGMI